jgi:3-oxoacyl-[acyl-carrier-protein] synthase-3
MLTLVNPMRTVITGTGSFIPAEVKLNRDFTIHEFYDERRQRIAGDVMEIIEKFEQITGISERRYACDDMNASGMAALAAARAIRDADADPETIDQLIVAHNFGDVATNSIQSAAVPSLASRVKKILGIKNPACVAYDLLFGCPGWVQGLIQADAFFKAGLAKKCLVVGTETLSRVIDPYDRDSMIFGDGAGAVLVEARPGIPPRTSTPGAGAPGAGILGSVAETHSLEESDYIRMGRSYFPQSDHCIRYMKMQGHKVYEFALSAVPGAMKACLEASKVEIDKVKKVFLHQANEKMDTAIIKAFYQLFNRQVPDCVMPMNIRELGNSSVATIPTLFDMVRKGVLPGHAISSGEIVLFASVGAGMNINAICYRL